jgi:hypothetical protein
MFEYQYRREFEAKIAKAKDFNSCKGPVPNRLINSKISFIVMCLSQFLMASARNAVANLRKKLKHVHGFLLESQHDYQYLINGIHLKANLERGVYRNQTLRGFDY